MSADLHVQ